MTGEPMAAVDAQFYWMSAKIPSDQFLAYGFGGAPVDLDSAVGAVLARARACPDLMLRVVDADPLRYPRWCPTPTTPAVVHHPGESWRDCLDTLAGLAATRLDSRISSWRLHVFASVRDLPTGAGPGVVVVLQVAHALADGDRASAMAAWLFGRDTAVPPVAVTRPSVLPVRAVAAARAHRQWLRDIAAGLLPAPPGDRPPLSTNTRPGGARMLHTLVRKRAQLPGPTVTIAVLDAVATALGEYLDDRGERCTELGAEVPMAKPGVRLGRNHFGNVGVGLYPHLDRAERVERIAGELAAGRLRAAHPATTEAARAFATVPAALLRWGISRFDTDADPPRVAGNTVVSSVNRGAADLSFGGVPVAFTTGFPALSPAMGLTHGVHGIGDTVVVSVHAAESALTDAGDYLRRLESRL